MPTGLRPRSLDNNTGPVHIAAVAHRSLIYALSPTLSTHLGCSPPRSIPRCTLQILLQSICPEGHHHCLRLVMPESIVRAACNSESGRFALKWERTLSGDLQPSRGFDFSTRFSSTGLQMSEVITTAVWLADRTPYQAH